MQLQRNTRPCSSPPHAKAERLLASVTHDLHDNVHHLPVHHHLLDHVHHIRDHHHLSDRVRHLHAQKQTILNCEKCRKSFTPDTHAKAKMLSPADTERLLTRMGQHVSPQMISRRKRIITLCSERPIEILVKVITILFSDTDAHYRKMHH